jgi:hypothetical protein
VEEAVVKCLEVCTNFNYPMRKQQLQDLVQSYCEEKGVKTRWLTPGPGSGHFARDGAIVSK